jgi:hypothetical protein
MEPIRIPYFPGYAEETAIGNPEKFAFEYSEFLENLVQDVSPELFFLYV